MNRWIDRLEKATGGKVVDVTIGDEFGPGFVGAPAYRLEVPESTSAQLVAEQIMAIAPATAIFVGGSMHCIPDSEGSVQAYRFERM